MKILIRYYGFIHISLTSPSDQLQDERTQSPFMPYPYDPQATADNVKARGRFVVRGRSLVLHPPACPVCGARRHCGKPAFPVHRVSPDPLPWLILIDLKQISVNIWQDDNEFCAFARRALHFDFPMMLFDHLKADRQTQAGTFAGLFGSKKRLKNAALMFR